MAAAIETPDSRLTRKYVVAAMENLVSKVNGRIGIAKVEERINFETNGDIGLLG